MQISFLYTDITTLDVDMFSHVQIPNNSNGQQMQQCEFYNLPSSSPVTHTAHCDVQKVLVSSFGPPCCNDADVVFVITVIAALTSLAIMFGSCKGCKSVSSAARLLLVCFPWRKTNDLDLHICFITELKLCFSSTT